MAGLVGPFVWPAKGRQVGDVRSRRIDCDDADAAGDTAAGFVIAGSGVTGVRVIAPGLVRVVIRRGGVGVMRLTGVMRLLGLVAAGYGGRHGHGRCRRRGQQRCRNQQGREQPCLHDHAPDFRHRPNQLPLQRQSIIPGRPTQRRDSHQRRLVRPARMSRQTTAAERPAMRAAVSSAAEKPAE